MCNSGDTVGKGVFYGGPCGGVIRRTTGVRIYSWEGTVIQGGLESRSREIAIVGAVTREWLVKTQQDGKG
jgi:hypothetical protein